MYSPFDTIAAVSTPFGKGGVAVIRLSGPDALTVAGRVFRPRSGKAVTDYPARYAVWGDIVVPDGAEAAFGRPGEVLDDGLCTLFRGPASYTGEDTAELSCHGGILVTRNVLTACLLAGARQALPGEYTRRAFLNGRLDLEKAEALGNLLDAGNDTQLRLSRSGMNGLLTRQAEAVYGGLCAVLSNMEAGIDFPEEDLTEMPREEILRAAEEALAEARRLLSTYRTGRAIAEGVPTVICGRPNVGKSAFFNRLVGRDAAIVTDIAGTTRDVLTETVSLGKVTLRLCDTAGLREDAGMDAVEKIGVERARAAMEQAELILYLSDPGMPTEADGDVSERELARAEAAGKTVIRVLTKSDLYPGMESVPGSIPVSSLTGDGFGVLAEAVEAAFIDGGLHVGEEAVVFSARQAAELASCASALARASANLRAGLTYDICADDIREAMSALGSLCGRTAREDVINEIFSRFCVGK
ncbi:MAG: tRNA uridine-5-carboxymethylaminomethyl(34) synthesis GTPase MnmE [Clostridia bacterium]|nr:tRNA uridine-5-carboxymethylaminomethyl(34) synthesis GTPase MnmE [Clostridia bacterium]